MNENRKRKIGNGPEQDKPRQWAQKLWDFDPVGYLNGLSGRRKRAGGIVTVFFAMLVIGSMVSGNAHALTPQEKLGKTFDNIQTFLIGVGIAVTGIMVVIAGIEWTASRGHPEKQSQVKSWLFGIAVGLCIIISSPVLIGIAKGLIVT